MSNFKKEEPKQEVQVVVENPTPPPAEIPTVDILVARRDLPIGTIVAEGDVDVQSWPQNLVLPDFVTQSKEQMNTELYGMVVRTPFKAREPLIKTKLANPNDPSFLAASLPKGMRAVTITADAISGVAGFIYPGDKVDVLISHEVQLAKDDDELAAADPIAEILVSNVKVLAVNQKATAHGEEGPQLPSSVTLEVSQADAQKLRLAEKHGELSLSLRSIEDMDEVDTVKPTGIADLSRITPPSYFPVLYDSNSEYKPQVVDIFAGQKPEEVDVKGGMDDMLGGLGKEKTEVIIVRGVKSEVVGVDRP
jgi:pilus assembly protein CpaB